MVTYRNIRNANSLSKSTSEVLGVTKNVLNYLRSLDIYIYIYIYIHLGFCIIYCLGPQKHNILTTVSVS